MVISTTGIPLLTDPRCEVATSHPSWFCWDTANHCEVGSWTIVFFITFGSTTWMAAHTALSVGMASRRRLVDTQLPGCRELVDQLVDPWPTVSLWERVLPGEVVQMFYRVLSWRKPWAELSGTHFACLMFASSGVKTLLANHHLDPSRVLAHEYFFRDATWPTWFGAERVVLEAFFWLPDSFLNSEGWFIKWLTVRWTPASGQQINCKCTPCSVLSNG